MAKREQALPRVCPVDRAEIEMASLELRRGRAAIGRHRAVPVYHEASEPLPGGIRLQRPARFAAPADRLLIAPAKRRAMVCAAPQSLVIHHQEYGSIGTIHDDAGG